MQLPSEDALRSGIVVLEQRVTPGDTEVIRACLASLVVMFEPNTRMTERQSDIRAKLWVEALGDLPTDLLVEASRAAMRTLKWMPKPSELHDIVREKIDLRWRELKRARLLLENASQQGIVKAQAQQTLSRAQRFEVNLRNLQEASRNWPRVGDAPRRDEAAAAAPARATPSATSPDIAAGLLLARARFWREQGRTAVASRLEDEAAALMPPEHCDIPEAAR